MKKQLLCEETKYTVVKRNGTLVPFKRERILRAVEAAFRDTKAVIGDSDLDSEVRESIDQMTGLVVKQLLSLASKGASLTVEGIQDVVEVTLMKHGYHDVARDYILYRNQRTEQREISKPDFKIYRKDRTTPVRFNPMKVASSIERHFRKARNIEDQTPDDVINAVNLLTKKIIEELSELSTKELF